MLRLLDETLEALLRDRVPLAQSEVTVAFDAPDTAWSAGLIRPTVNLFLVAVTPSEGQSSAGMAVYEENGTRVRRPPYPRLQCSYLVTAWTTDVRDEHQLLGAVLAAVLKEPTVDASFVPAVGAGLVPPVMWAVARESNARGADFWSAVGGKLKVGLDLAVTAGVDAAAVTAIGPPTVSYHVRVGDVERESSRRLVGGTAPGAPAGTLVRTARGVARVDDDGRFKVFGLPGDVVVVETKPPRQAVIPDNGAVVVSSGSG